MALLDIFRRNGGKQSGLKRERKTHGARNAYMAAARDRLLADFTADLGSADSILRDSLETLRARSRDFERNNEYYAWYLNLMKMNVVGPEGIKLQSKARNPDNSVDEAGNNMIEAEWKTWCKKQNLMVDGMMSMIDLLGHISQAVPRDGEVILRKVKNSNYPKGIALQLIEPDLLDEKLNHDARQSGNQIRMGVEIDRSTKRPVAYHFLRNHPGDYEYATQVGSKHIRVPADEIIHIFKRERAGQTRGVPWAANVIRSLKMLHGYREAELVAARVGASKMGFFVSKSGEEFPADDFEESADIRADTGAPIMNADPGTFHELPEGMDFRQFDADHPNQAFADFERAILRGVASGLGINYSALSNDFEGISYSSIRHGALTERDFYKVIQKFVIEHFLDEIYPWWLDHCMDFGLLPFSGMTKFSKFTRHVTWQPRGFAWVDPEKEMKANQIALNNGLTSHSDIIATQGKDAEEMFAQIQRDRDSASRYGLEMNYTPFGDKNAGNQPQEPQDGEEEDGNEDD